MKRLSRLFDNEFLMRGRGEWITTKREEEEEGEEASLSASSSRSCPS